jgi:magnesium-transporting ATPase (P-type)
MLERKKTKPINNTAFLWRMVLWFFVTFVMFLASIAVGIWGYSHYENMPFVDAFLNASMILGGMGPVDVLKTESGKLFASFYAVYSGFFLVVVGGLLLVPIFHRVLHVFHADDED